MGLLSQRNLLAFALRNRNVVAEAQPSRLLFVYAKSFSFCTSQTSKQNEELTIEEISAFLKQSNWQYLMESSNIPKKLNPDVVRSVLQHNRISDNEDTNISSIFEEASDFSDHVEHIGRSATLVMAYLMLRKNLTLLKAWNTLKRVHHRAQPNHGFAKILLDLDRKLHGTQHPWNGDNESQ